MSERKKKRITHTAPPCPNMLDHTDGPTGYLQWHEWAKKMGKTHAQSRCSGCGLFKIWTRRT